MGERDVIRIMAEIIYGEGWSSNDVAYVDCGEGRYWALAIDTVVEKTDSPPGMNPRMLARKAVVNVVSDLASKGVKPMLGLFSLTLPRERMDEETMSRVTLEGGVRVKGGEVGEPR